MDLILPSPIQVLVSFKDQLQVPFFHGDCYPSLLEHLGCVRLIEKPFVLICMAVFFREKNTVPWLISQQPNTPQGLVCT